MDRLIIIAAVILSALIGVAVGVRLPHRNKSGMTEAGLRSVTRLLFVSTQVSALVWVFASYAIAIYSTVRLQQVYTMSELSKPAIETLLGVTALKVVENIFEHNDGTIFGKSKTTDTKSNSNSEPESDTFDTV